MKKVLPITLLFMLILALPLMAATYSYYIESPALAAVLSKLSSIKMAYSNTTILTNDPYKYAVFTPLAPIVLVDTGVNYNAYTAKYFHYCSFTGFAPTGLINWLDSQGACIATGTITLAELANVLPQVRLIDVTGLGDMFTIPTTNNVYKFCITTTTLLQQKVGVTDVGTLAQLNTGDRPDTIIILQPTSWNDDLYGHGTAVASALCGKVTTNVTIGSDTLSLTTYLGAATGAKIYVVNIGTYAIVLPDFNIDEMTALKQVIKSFAKYPLISYMAVTNTIQQALKSGVTPLLDYKFVYLGSQLAAEDVIQSLSAIQNDLANALNSETRKPVMLINMALLLNNNPNITYNAGTLCKDLENVVLSIPAIKLVVAPTGNDMSAIDVITNNTQYLWPTQCTYVLALQNNTSITPDVISNMPLQVMPAEGYKFYVTYNDTTKMANITIPQDLNGLPPFEPYGNYYRAQLVNAINMTNATAVVAEPAALKGTAKIPLNISGTVYDLELDFNGIPVLYPCGSIFAIKASNDCPYGEGLIVPSSNVNGKTITISFPGFNGTSFAAAYATALAALTVFDNPAATDMPKAIAQIVEAAVRGKLYVHNFTAYAVWRYISNENNAPIVWAYPTTTFPYTIPSGSLYLFGGAFPAATGGGGTAETFGTQQTTTPSLAVPTTTTSPQIAKPSFPGVALLAPLLSKALSAIKRRRRQFRHK